MRNEQDTIKSEMMKQIYDGGAWFRTKADNYLKIGFSEADNRLCARECVIKEGTLEGHAYTFGTDWFDISFHGRRIDIYVDPDTFRKWNICYDPDKGTYADHTGTEGSPSMQLLNFCRQADKEALNGIGSSFLIDSAGFAEEMQSSDNGRGKLGDILRKARENGSLDNLEKQDN